MRKRGPETWELRVYLGRENGRSVYRTRTVKGSERFARMRLKDFRDECAAVIEARKKAGGSTVGDLLNTYYRRRTASGGWSRRTSLSCRLVVDKHLAPLADVRLEELEANHIAELYEALSSGEVTGKKLRPATVQRAHGVLRGALAEGVAYGMLPRNPAAVVKPPSADRKEYVLPTPAAIARAVPLVAAGDAEHKAESHVVIGDTARLDRGVTAWRARGTALGRRRLECSQVDDPPFHHHGRGQAWQGVSLSQ